MGGTGGSNGVAVLLIYGMRALRGGAPEPASGGWLDPKSGIAFSHGSAEAELVGDGAWRTASVFASHGGHAMGVSTRTSGDGFLRLEQPNAPTSRRNAQPCLMTAWW
jgi:hypothetical protein